MEEEKKGRNPQKKMRVSSKTETATFAAGCFWGVEELFRKLPGVKSTRVGYTGGKAEKPSYEMVCTGITGHAEALEIVFDPKKTSYAKLLEIFFTNHNPTMMNRQGWDIGTQYRSAVFYHTAAQRKEAEKAKERAEKEGRWAGKKIVTQIVPAGVFWEAEEYHQKYLYKKGEKSCHI